MSVRVTRTFASSSASPISAASADGSAANTVTSSRSVSATVSMPVTGVSSGNGETLPSSVPAVSESRSRSSTGVRATFTSSDASGTDNTASCVPNRLAASFRASTVAA